MTRVILPAVNRIDVYTTTQRTTVYIFFSGAHETFSRINHILGQKISFNRFKKIKIISSIFCNHDGMKLELNNSEKMGTFTNMWKLKTIFFNSWPKGI